MITDRDHYARMVKAGQDALDEKLSRDNLLRKFAELIGEDVSELQPVYTR